MSWDPGEYRLSVYEQQRTPHTTITDDRVVSLPMKELDTELVCPICLSLCRGTSTTMDCLHRFCGDCITKSIRFDNRDVKMCPTCRQAIPSGHRSLRPDPVFDALVEHVYPDPEIYDNFEVEVLQKMQLFSNSRAFSDSVQEGMKHQALARSQRGRSRNTTRDSHTESAHPSKKRREAPAAAATPASPKGISVEMKRSATEPGKIALPELRSRYLTVPNDCCVAHLVQFVTDRLLELDQSLKGKLGADKATFSVVGCAADRRTKLKDCIKVEGTAVVVHYGWTSVGGASKRFEPMRSQESAGLISTAAPEMSLDNGVTAVATTNPLA